MSRRKRASAESKGGAKSFGGNSSTTEEKRSKENGLLVKKKKGEGGKIMQGSVVRKDTRKRTSVRGIAEQKGGKDKRVERDRNGFRRKIQKSRLRSEQTEGQVSFGGSG